MESILLPTATRHAKVGAGIPIAAGAALSDACKIPNIADRASAYGIPGKPHLVRVNDYWLEIEPSGSYMLFTEHKDRPGMIGAVGTIIGNADINISQMQVSRGVQRGGGAMMVLCLDEPLTTECHQQILAIPDMYRALIVRLAR